MKRLNKIAEEKTIKFSIADKERKLLNDQLRFCSFNKIDYEPYGYREIIDLTKCIRIPRFEGIDSNTAKELIDDINKAIKLAENFKYNGYQIIY